MDTAKKNVALLAGCQGLLIANNSILTTLLTECHTPAERATAQGANDLAIFITMAVTSLSSGLLFTLQGWETMNRLAVPFLLVSGAAMVWLAARRRHAKAKATA